MNTSQGDPWSFAATRALPCGPCTLGPPFGRALIPLLRSRRPPQVPLDPGDGTRAQEPPAQVLDSLGHLKGHLRSLHMYSPAPVGLDGHGCRHFAGCLGGSQALAVLWRSGAPIRLGGPPGGPWAPIVRAPAIPCGEPSLHVCAMRSPIVRLRRALRGLRRARALAPLTHPYPPHRLVRAPTLATS